MSLFSDAMDLPQGAYLDFPRTREWEVAAANYRTLFAAYVVGYGIGPQDLHDSQIRDPTLDFTFKSIWRALTRNGMND